MPAPSRTHERNPSARFRGPLGVLALLVALLTAEGAPAADSVYLHTGELFSGTILRISDREVAIQLESGGILHFRRSQIEKVKRWVPDKPLPEVIFFKSSRRRAPRNPAIRQPAPGQNPFKTLDIESEPTDVSPTAEPETGGEVVVQPVTPVTPIVTEPVEPVNVEPATLDPVDTSVVTPIETVPEIDPVVEPAPAIEGESLPRTEWTLKAPEGFQVTPRARREGLVASWFEPSTQALVNLARYSDDRGLVAFKDMLLTNVPGTVPAKVFRDIPLNREGPGGFQGWILELEQEIAGTRVRQLSLVVDSPDGVFVLRCTVPASVYPRLSPRLEQSLHSFRLALVETG